MKSASVILFAVFLSAARLAADSVQFTESSMESLKRVLIDPEFGDYDYVEVSSEGFTVTGVITVPGLNSNRLDQLDGINLGLGDLDYSFSIEEAASASAGRLVFRITKEVETGEDIIQVPVGSVTLTRNGNVLSFVVTASKLPGESSIAAGGYSEPEDEEDLRLRSVSGSASFRLELGDLLSFERTLYYRGTASYRRQRVGIGDEAMSYILATVSLTGSADYARPAVSFISPKPNQRVSNEVFTVTGRASDNGALAEIWVKVNDGEFEPAELPETGNTWRHEVALEAGTNTIAAYCTDADGNVSPTVRVKCFYVVTNSLTLIVGEGGSVTGVADQQVLEIGRGYQATARADATHLFYCWSNSVSGISTSATHRFLMSPDLVLAAKFIPNPWLPNVGTYRGLFAPSTDAAVSNSGYVSLQLTAAGRLTGRLIQAGKTTRAISGKVDREGHAVATVLGTPGAILIATFDLTNGTGTVEGGVATAAWQAAFRAVRQVAQPALAGKHTFYLPGAGAAQAADHPAGDGAGVLTISPNGAASFTGNLGDGSALVAASGVGVNGDLPVFAPQFGGKGFFLGWLMASTNSPPFLPLTVTGSALIWLKPPGLAGQTTYRGGFLETKTLLGARYTQPASGANALNWTSGLAQMDGGHLSTALFNGVTVTGTKLTAIGGSIKLTLSLDAPRGKWSGSFVHPITGRTTFLKGAVLQLPVADFGAGWFIGGDQSGYVNLRTSAP